MSTLITESGDTIMLETVAGISSASTLNDISVVTIYKELFTTDPSTRGWLVGTTWVWDSVNLRMKIV
jgi:hypothetical protein